MPADQLPLNPESAGEFQARVESVLHSVYVACEDAALRREDRKKAVEVASMLREIARVTARLSNRTVLDLVDAASGNGYVGLLAASLVLSPAGRAFRLTLIERDPQRVERSRAAAHLLGFGSLVDLRCGEVRDPALWPESPSVVTALHACGSAADAVLEGAALCRARHLLLVPCCTSSDLAAVGRAQNRAEDLGIPRQAPVRRRFVQACVDSERTWRMEALGYETEVVEFVGATVTPHNLLWRGRRTLDAVRMARARSAMAAWGADT